MKKQTEAEDELDGRGVALGLVVVTAVLVLVVLVAKVLT